MRPYVTVHDAELDALLSPDSSSGGLLLGLSNPLFETRKGLPTSHSLLHVDAARNNANGGGSAGGGGGEADSCGSTPAVRWCSPQPTLVRTDGRLLDQLSVRSSPIIRRREHGTAYRDGGAAAHRDGDAAAASAAVADVAAGEEAADAAAATALGQHFGALTAGLLAPLERWQRTHACAHPALPPPWCTQHCHARPLTHTRPACRRRGVLRRGPLPHRPRGHGAAAAAALACAHPGGSASDLRALRAIANLQAVVAGVEVTRSGRPWRRALFGASG